MSPVPDRPIWPNRKPRQGAIAAPKRIGQPRPRVAEQEEEDVIIPSVAETMDIEDDDTFQNAAPIADTDTDFGTPLGEDHPDDVAAAMEHSLSLRVPTEEDFDRLWDWVRADKDEGARFLGRPISTSRELRQWAVAFGPALFSMVDMDEHIGFVGLNPFTEEQAVIHLYLTQTARNQLKRIVPQLLALSAEQYPGVNLIVATKDMESVRLWQPFGFTLTYLLTRPAAV